MAMLKSNGGENSIGSCVHKEDGQNDEHFNNYLTCHTQAVTTQYSEYKFHMEYFKGWELNPY